MGAAASEHEEFLAAAEAAVKDKLKTLKYRFRRIDVTHQESISSGGGGNATIFRFQKSMSTKSVRITIGLWADRWVSLDARKPGKKGWDWCYSYEGRLSGDHQVGVIIDLVKELDDALHPERGFEGVTEESRWYKILLRGPSRLAKK
jgi:hypothetical protein